MNILVTGSGKGLGKVLCSTLNYDGHTVIPIDRSDVSIYATDVSEEKDVYKLHNFLQEQHLMPNCIINNAGINYINWLQETPTYEWNNIMDTNAKSIFLMSRMFADHLCDVKGTILNITSNAAWMPMTNSIAYNASKGAAHIMTLQLARELSPKGVTVFGIAPNKLKGTGMSTYIENTVCSLRGWTPEEAAEYQLKALPAGEETTPEAVAEFIAYLLQDKDHHKFLTGTIIPYGK